MKLFLILLVVAVAVAQEDDWLSEEICGCVLGPDGDGAVAHPCGYLCADPMGYHCHMFVKPCDNAYDTCQMTAGGWACACTGTCSVCGESVCGQVCTDSALCPTGQTCMDDGLGVYSCQTPCTPTCEDKACGADDGCGNKCATGFCTKKKETCGGGGIEFVCGKKEEKKKTGLAWVVGLVGAVLGAVGCAAGVVVYKKKGKKLVAQPAAQSTAIPEVETDPGTDA